MLFPFGADSLEVMHCQSYLIFPTCRCAVLCFFTVAHDCGRLILVCVFLGRWNPPQGLREAPDELPRPGAREQAECGVPEVLQPQARRRLTLITFQEAAVSLSRGSLLLLIFSLCLLDMLFAAAVYHRFDGTPFRSGPVFCSWLWYLSKSVCWSVYLDRRQMLNDYRSVRLIVCVYSMSFGLFMPVVKMWCLLKVKAAEWKCGIWTVNWAGLGRPDVCPLSSPAAHAVRRFSSLGRLDWLSICM